MPLFRKSSMESFVSPSPNTFESHTDSQSLRKIRPFSQRYSRRFPDIPESCVYRTTFVDVRQKGFSLGTWNRLHLKMTNHTLSLHRKEGLEPLEIIVLRKVVHVERVNVTQYCLQIDTAQRKIYQFAFDSDDHLYTWLTDIHKVISPVGKPTNFQHHIHVTEGMHDKTRLIGLPETWHPEEWQNDSSSLSRRSLIDYTTETDLPKKIFAESMVDVDTSLSCSRPVSQELQSIVDHEEAVSIIEAPQVAVPPPLQQLQHFKSEKQALKIIIQDLSGSKPPAAETPYAFPSQRFPSTPHLTPDQSPLIPRRSSLSSGGSPMTPSGSPLTPGGFQLLTPSSGSLATPNTSPLTLFRDSPYCYRESDAQDLTGQIYKLGNWPDAHGGYADIWRAQWETESRVSCTVAVKVLRVIGSDESMLRKIRRRLKNEVRVWHQLRHKNIVQMYGTCDGFGPTFTSMVSAWFDNGNIIAYLRELGDASTVELRLKLLTEVAAGLNYLHTFSFPVVHGDLKGANILVNSNGEAALADFGLSSILNSIGDSGTMTFAGGSIRWMAPEVLQQSPHHFGAMKCASDTYSYGSVILEVLTGEKPYKDILNDMQVITLRVVQGCKPKRPIMPSVNTAVWELMERCWSTIPTERPHIAYVLLRMEHFLAEQRKSMLPQTRRHSVV